MDFLTLFSQFNLFFMLIFILFYPIIWFRLRNVSFGKRLENTSLQNQIQEEKCENT